jgi:methylase of polypeptide subunit release factors
MVRRQTKDPRVLNFWRTIEHQHIKPALRRMRPYRTATFAGVRVAYKNHLDGGGSTFGQEFVPVLRGRGMPKVQRAFEWCAGPGFIGFSLLAHGLTETLCLADVNGEAVAACRKTVADNRLEDRVAVYRSDNLKDIPASEQWDLVVSNPPHFGDTGFRQLRYDDPDWRLHRGFFGAIARHLKANGVVVLQENNDGSTPDTFAGMIAEAGLKVVFEQGASPVRTTDSRMFYLGIMRPGDAVPAWARG